MNKEFNLSNIQDLWNQVCESENENIFDKFYNQVTQNYGEAFVYIVYHEDNDTRVYGELLQLAVQQSIKSYVTFEDDFMECTVIVALYK